MPRSKDGNEWIVTWVDRTSKTIVAAAAAHKHTSTEDLAQLTFKEICCRFGSPKNLTMFCEFVVEILVAHLRYQAAIYI